jgi:hypothetical protein
MLRRVPPSEAWGGATGFSPWGSTYCLERPARRSGFARPGALPKAFWPLLKGGDQVLDPLLLAPYALRQDSYAMRCACLPVGRRYLPACRSVADQTA